MGTGKNENSGGAKPKLGNLSKTGKSMSNMQSCWNSRNGKPLKYLICNQIIQWKWIFHRLVRPWKLIQHRLSRRLYLKSNRLLPLLTLRQRLRKWSIHQSAPLNRLDYLIVTETAVPRCHVCPLSKNIVNPGKL